MRKNKLLILVICAGFLVSCRPAMDANDLSVTLALTDAVEVQVKATETPEDFSNNLQPVEAPTATVVVLPSPIATIDSADLLAGAKALYFAEDYSGAILLYDEIILQDSQSAFAYNGRGLVYTALGNYEQAISDFTLAAIINPNYAAAFNNRGEVLFFQNSPELALLDFSKAIELDPVYGVAYQNRALLQKDLGQPGAAIVDLQVYLALVPDADDRLWVEELLTQLAEQTRIFTDDVEGRIFADDFSNPSAGGWYGGGTGVAAFFENDYRVIVSQADEGAWAFNANWMTDMTLEADTRRVSGPTNNLFGLICRYQDDRNYYALVISSDGYYGIGVRTRGGALEPAGSGGGQLRYSDVINKGGEVNHISASCIGSTIKLSVNGITLIEVQDYSLGSGMSGVFAAAYSVPGVEISFDRFELFQP